MAISLKNPPNRGEQVIKYIAGSANFPGVGACGVAVGDIITIKAMTGPGLQFLVPDEFGHLPHIAYYPGSNGLTDPLSEVNPNLSREVVPAGPGPRPLPRAAPVSWAGGAMRGTAMLQTERKTRPGFVFTNDASAPVIRVDLSRPLFCRYPGEWQIEGGALANGAPSYPDNLILISYTWARQWVNELDGIAVMVMSLPPVEHSLTYYNVARGSITLRPHNADAVFSPEPQNLLATMTVDPAVPATTQANLAQSSSQFVPLGPFPAVQAPADLGALVFRVWL